MRALGNGIAARELSASHDLRLRSCGPCKRRVQEQVPPAAVKCSLVDKRSACRRLLPHVRTARRRKAGGRRCRATMIAERLTHSAQELYGPTTVVRPMSSTTITSSNTTMSAPRCGAFVMSHGSECLVPTNEPERLTAVRRYDILDTPPDGAFDRITAMAARIFDVPISIVSIVDHDRIWFKSHHGLDVPQIDRGPGLCASAILRDESRILLDASKDAHAMANPLVAGEFGLRFYLGVPLHTHDGFNLGTLCVIDQTPRKVSAEQIAHLKDLAEMVMDQLELRRSARAAVETRIELLQELNHRVRNSLQLVSTLLTLQSRGAAPEISEEFKIAANRVVAIGRVHDRLSSADPVGRVAFKAYAGSLCDEIAKSIFSGKMGSQLICDSDDVEVTTDQATALGLVLNELITNAAKHSRGVPRINVTFRKTGAEFHLAVSDEGAGLPAGFDPAKSKGLGMRVIHSMVEKIGGTLRFATGENGRGTRVDITFA